MDFLINCLKPYNEFIRTGSTPPGGQGVMAPHYFLRNCFFYCAYRNFHHNKQSVHIMSKAYCVGFACLVCKLMTYILFVVVTISGVLC